MRLSAQDTQRFYRIWWPLLRYVNAKHHIVPDLPPLPGEGTLNGQDAYQIREVLWASDALREAFIADNPASLPAADLALVASWRERVAGRFFILRHLKILCLPRRRATAQGLWGFGFGEPHPGNYLLPGAAGAGTGRLATL